MVFLFANKNIPFFAFFLQYLYGSRFTYMLYFLDGP